MCSVYTVGGRERESKGMWTFLHAFVLHVAKIQILNRNVIITWWVVMTCELPKTFVKANKYLTNKQTSKKNKPPTKMCWDAKQSQELLCKNSSKKTGEVDDDDDEEKKDTRTNEFIYLTSFKDNKIYTKEFSISTKHFELHVNWNDDLVVLFVCVCVFNSNRTVDGSLIQRCSGVATTYET